MKGLAAFLVGLFANLAQIAALRLFLGTFAGTELHLGLFLGIWLGGIAIGSAWAGMQAISLPRLLTVVAISPALSLFTLLGILHRLPTSQGLLLPLSHSLLLMLGLLVPLALPLGAFLPTLIRYRKASMGTLASPYAIEAGGSFVAGLLFSVILGGQVSPVTVFLILPLPALLALAAVCSFRRGLFLLLLAWPMLAMFAVPGLEQEFEQQCWKRLQPGTSLQESRETPYQRISIGEYDGQKSLLVNGLFVDNWPDPIRAEERIHTFLTAVASPSSLLIVGTPVPDILIELAKYPDLHTTLVDLDGRFQTFMAREYGNLLQQRFTQLTADPRQFLRTATATWDAILLLPSDPTSLADNRLFTAEAFHLMAARLNPRGVLGFTLAGTENYLGEELQETILSTWKTLRAAFPETFALPGESIQFWASPTPGALATDPALLSERFSRRAIPTVSFVGAAFANRLLPFRVQELQSWLKRPIETTINSDAHPKAFHRQLQLWDIYSDSRLSPLLRFLSRCDLRRTFFASMLIFALLALLLPILGRAPRQVTILGLSAGLSGGVSLLGELGLIYLFQNREGAMIQQAALFFGIYMAGLACGSISGARIPGSLFRLKVAQAASFGGGAVLARCPELNGLLPVSTGIFLIAFLAGRELPLLDRQLREGCGFTGGSSSGLLFWADNLGGMIAAVAAGPWLFPILGVEATFILATALLTGNAILLLVGLR